MPGLKRISAAVLLTIATLLIFQSTNLGNLCGEDNADRQNDAGDQFANLISETSVEFGICEKSALGTEAQSVSCDAFISFHTTDLRTKSPRFSRPSIFFLSDAGLMPRAPELA